MFEPAVVVISLDAEQIWGYMDLLDEPRFSKRYPNVTGAYDAVLDRLCAARIKATWALVGALTLDGMAGPGDPRLQGLPENWTAKIPAAPEVAAPMWFRRSFARRLRQADPPQDVGLHGGLTHLVWTDPWSTIDAIQHELAGGIDALREISIQPRSFIFCRQRISHLELLPPLGIRCYRGNPAAQSALLENQIPRAINRVLEELGRTTPPVVWPTESLPGLWNIPGSLSLYPIGRYRTSIVPMRTRIERVRRGLEAAVSCGGIFHYWFHPDTLAEGSGGLSMLDAILEILIRARDAGRIEILTMAEVADRMESRRERPLASTYDVCGPGAQPGAGLPVHSSLGIQ